MAIIDQQAALNKMALLSGMLGQMASIFGENTIAYKAFASAQAVIDTYLAANNALAQLPVPLNFVGAAVSIATGLANVAKINGVALAQGGLAYGPTNALIGEYAGAGSNPEVIAPLDKLKDMMGGGSTRVYGRLYAGDIYLSNKRGARQMERRGAR
jgi:phage tail protein X